MVVDCSICFKPIEEKSNWNWGEEPAHKLCVLNTAQVACDSMCCFDLEETADETNNECECGEKLKTITERERKALLV